LPPSFIPCFDINMKQEKNYLTLLTIVLGFIIFYVILDFEWMLWTAIGIAVSGVVSSQFGNVIAGGWIKLGEGLGKITGPIILGVVFFTVLFPVAVLFRMLGKDNLMIKKAYKTTFLTVNKTFQKEDFEKVW
jgi:hypothetical protein